MSLPGFTAETILIGRPKSYLAVASEESLDSGIIPANPPCRMCDDIAWQYFNECSIRPNSIRCKQLKQWDHMCATGNCF